MKTTTQRKGNGVIFYGGGIAPGAKELIAGFADSIAKRGIHEFMLTGFSSFASLVRANPEPLKAYFDTLNQIAEVKAELEKLAKPEQNDSENQEKYDQASEKLNTLENTLATLQIDVNNEKNVRIWNDQLAREILHRGNAVFRTHRSFNLADPNHPEWMQKALEFCEKCNITTIYVCGGDGSSRQMAELAPIFEEHGTKFVFLVPATIDGIEGGPGIGRESAVAFCAEMVRIQAGTNLQTEDVASEDGETYSGCIIEFPGRNRNDLLAGYAEYLCQKMAKEENMRTYPDGYLIGIDGIPFDQIQIIMIPAAGIEWDFEHLINETVDSRMRTLILVSEGADMSKKDLSNLYKGKRKFRKLVIGHTAQNCPLLDEERSKIRGAIHGAIQIIAESAAENTSFCLLYKMGFYNTPVKVSIDYFAERNPRDLTATTLPEGWMDAMMQFVPQ